MKILITLSVILCALLFSSVAWSGRASTIDRKEKAVFNFDKPVVLTGIKLQGQYLFVHDSSAMDQGEACTYVYKGNAEVADKLVISFHCTPAERAKVTHFTVRTAQTSQGTVELREFQFAGDTETHIVPASVERASVNIMN